MTKSIFGAPLRVNSIQPLQVQTGDVGVGKSGGFTPDAKNHLFDELLWALPSVGARLG
jgi:hypothetical protein